MTDYIIDRIVRLEGTDYDRRRKLSTQDVVKIRKAYVAGYSITKLASMFGVSYLTIKYHIDEDFKTDIKKRRACYAPSAYDATAQRRDRIAYKKSILKSEI